MTNPKEPVFSPVVREGDVQTTGVPDAHGHVSIVIPTSFYDRDWEETLSGVVAQWNGYFAVSGDYSGRKLFAKVQPHHMLNDPGIKSVVEDVEKLIGATNSHYEEKVMTRRRTDYQNQLTAQQAKDDLQAQLKKAVEDFNGG